MKIDAKEMAARTLCDAIKACAENTLEITNVNGQRYMAIGCGKKDIAITGTPGNALGAYLDGAAITVNGNVQDAVGDTMNEGAIVVHGSAGDATGYAMRGGRIYVKGNAGYRAGIHMKAYKEKQPVLIVGGHVGSFLGEYQAGGTIMVLGMDCNGKAPVGRFTGTGMHGGRIFLRCKELPADLPAQVITRKATAADMDDVDAYLNEYCAAFGLARDDFKQEDFFVLIPDTKNPYKQLYCYS